MNGAWYRVAGMAFGYFAAAAAALVLLLALRQDLADRRLWRRLHRNTPGIGMACSFRVITSSARRLPVGTVLPVPFEGTLGAASSCDVQIPYRKVHLRSAFFWIEEDGLHMAPLHRDGFFADEVRAEPGDEAILRDGAELRIGDLVLRLSMNRSVMHETTDGPYVTHARRYRAKAGHGEGVGALNGREARRDPEESSNRKKHDKNSNAEKTQNNNRRGIDIGHFGAKNKGSIKTGKAGTLPHAARSKANGPKDPRSGEGAGRKDKRTRDTHRDNHRGV